MVCHIGIKGSVAELAGGAGAAGVVLGVPRFG